LQRITIGNFIDALECNSLIWIISNVYAGVTSISLTRQRSSQYHAYSINLGRLISISYHRMYAMDSGPGKVAGINFNQKTGNMSVDWTK